MIPKPSESRAILDAEKAGLLDGQVVHRFGHLVAVGHKRAHRRKHDCDGRRIGRASKVHAGDRSRRETAQSVAACEAMSSSRWGIACRRSDYGTVATCRPASTLLTVEGTRTNP